MPRISVMRCSSCAPFLWGLVPGHHFFETFLADSRVTFVLVHEQAAAARTGRGVRGNRPAGPQPRVFDRSKEPDLGDDAPVAPRLDANARTVRALHLGPEQRVALHSVARGHDPYEGGAVVVTP